MRDGLSDPIPPYKVLRRSDESPVSRHGDNAGHSKARVSHSVRGKNGKLGRGNFITIRIKIQFLPLHEMDFRLLRGFCKTVKTLKKMKQNIWYLLALVLGLIA